MSMRFCILGSGSSGNCALLKTEQSCVLVDAGFSARKTNQLLAPLGESLETVDAVFITHEHGDHAAIVSGLAKYPRVKVFANAPTAKAVQAGLEFKPAWQLFETGARFCFQDLEIESFSVPHDAQEPVGFVFTHGKGDLFSPVRRLAWLTDLGHAPQHVRERIREVDVIAVEANHCPDLLKADRKRPWSVKQRISGRHGHLSNDSVRELLATVASPRWRQVYFTHLSRDCNSPETVDKVMRPTLSALGCGFSIVAPGMSTPVYEFS